MSSVVRAASFTVFLAVFLTPGIASAQARRGTPPAARAAGPWFGTALPAAVSDPTKPVMKYDDTFAPIAAKFPHAAGQHDELLDGAELKAAMKTIVGFSLESYAAGDKVWGRRSTTPAFFHAIEWAVAQFKAAGIADAKVERFPIAVPMWTPKSWRVQLNGDDAFGAGSANVILTSAFPQPGGTSIAGGSITAPVVFAGHGTDADLAGRDVKGKIAVIHVRPEPSLFGSAEQGAAARVVAHGAIGVIEAVEGPGNALYFDTRFAAGATPAFMTGGQDGWFLETVIGKAANAGVLDKLTATISLDTEEKTGLTSANGIAVIRGESGKRIIVNAHADGYFQGGDDNASGFAALIGLARYFAKQPKPKHTLMFVASAGHHGPGNGPGSLVTAHPELKDNTLLVLNLEHLAYSDIVRGKTRAPDNFGMVWETSVTEGAKAVGVTNEAPFLIDLWKRAPRCFGVATYQSISAVTPGDLGGYRPLNAPMTQMIQSGTFYHSSGDVYEAVPAAGLERAARFFASFIQQVDRAPEGLIQGEKGAGGARMSVCGGDAGDRR
jgi:Peptidase family M28/PA domain